MNEFETYAKAFETQVRESGLAFERDPDTRHFTLQRVPFQLDDPCRLEWHHDPGEFMVDLSFWHHQNPTFCLSRVQLASQPADHVFLYWDLADATIEQMIPREARAFMKELAIREPRTRYPVHPQGCSLLLRQFINRYKSILASAAHQGVVR
ncbi:hypothetical protein IT407_04875 [Candidatus Uhrbacteria bacterium]|nr:hypothetical protein [Candidatus Uhrbacteria bacterium]